MRKLLLNYGSHTEAKSIRRMVKDHTAVWDSCLDTIRRNVNSQSFKTWFEPIKPVRLANEALTIQVPNKFFYEWLEEHYVQLLKRTIREALGDTGRLEYQILMGKRKALQKIKNQGYVKTKLYGKQIYFYTIDITYRIEQILNNKGFMKSTY